MTVSSSKETWSPSLSSREGSMQGLILQSRAVVEKKDFVASGVISFAEGDIVTIDMAESRMFELNDPVKMAVYVPGGIRTFHSRVIAKDDAALYIIMPPKLRGEEKREAPRIPMEKTGKIISYITSGNRERMALQQPLECKIRNISSSGIGFVLGAIQRLSVESTVEIDVELGTPFSFKADIVRRETLEEGYFYGARFNEIQTDKQNSLRAFIIRTQIQTLSKLRQTPEAAKKRAFR